MSELKTERLMKMYLIPKLTPCTISQAKIENNTASLGLTRVPLHSIYAPIKLLEVVLRPAINIESKRTLG